MKYYSGDFTDTNGVKFIEGPFFLLGVRYDYKLIEGKPIKENIDYCTINQMTSWGIRMA
jgi:hypothetical protein